MFNYDLFVLLKSGEEKEFTNELEKTYNEKLEKLRNIKQQYQDNKDKLRQISDTIFEEKEYVLNPEASFILQLTTKLKIDTQSLQLYVNYKKCETKEMLLMKDIIDLHDELLQISFMLEDYNIIKNIEDFRLLFD